VVANKSNQQDLTTTTEPVGIDEHDHVDTHPE
jgi:hypothetical protein